MRDKKTEHPYIAIKELDSSTSWTSISTCASCLSCELLAWFIHSEQHLL